MEKFNKISPLLKIELNIKVTSTSFKSLKIKCSPCSYNISHVAFQHPVVLALISIGPPIIIDSIKNHVNHLAVRLVPVAEQNALA